MPPEANNSPTASLPHPPNGNGAPSPPVVPDHELLRHIGQGAYGEVWLARNVLGAYRAVKVVYRHSFREERAYEREFRGIQKYEPVSRSNDGLLDIFQAGRNDEAGYYYYVMELADAAEPQVSSSEFRVSSSATTFGNVQPETRNLKPETYVPRTLQFDLQKRGRFLPTECVQLGLNLTLALGHLHRRGLIHRDIKPANTIFVEGVPKLADIGLVTTFDDTCSFVGTDGFVAPEGPTSPRADLFSLGKVLYEISTGKDRKDFPEPATGLGEHSDGEELAELNAVILKACAPQLQDRYPSAEEFHADLALLNSGRSVRRRRRLETRVAVLTRVALVIGIVALLGFGGYAFQRGQTGEARRLLQENRRLAEAEARERHRAEQALLMAQFNRAQAFIEERKDAAALAQYGQLLRQHPTNRLIAEQIMATLSQRNFALPIARLSHSNMTHASFSTDGTWILTDSRDGTGQVFEARTGNPVRLPIRHDPKAHWIEFSPDGERIAAATRHEVRVSSTHTGALVMAFAAGGAIDRLLFSPDGAHILIVGGSEASIHDVHSGRLVAGPFDHGGKIDSAAFNLEGGRVVTYSKKTSTARVWDARNGRSVGGPFEHTPMYNFPVRPRLSPDGRRLLTVLTTTSAGPAPAGTPAPFDDGTAARLWTVDTGQALSDVIERTSGIRCVEFSRDGTRVFIACNDRLGWIYDGQNGRQLTGPFRQEEAINAAAFSQDGRKLATGSGNAFVRLWDSASGAPLAGPLRQGFETTSIHSIRTLQFSPDGEHLLIRAVGAAWLWDVRPGAAQSRVLHHEEPVTYAEFNQDGRRIVTSMDEQISSGIRGRSARGNSAVIWNVESGQRVGGPLRHERGVTTVAFSPDGRRIATASRDRTARVWNAETGQALGPPLVHGRAVGSAWFSQDGRQLWTGCLQHSAWLWDVERGALIANLLKNEGEPLEFLGWPGRPDDLSRDQNWIVTCSRTARGDSLQPATGVQVWNAQTGQPRHAPVPLGISMRSARFSPDAERFVSTAYAGGAFIWNARTGELLIGPIQHEGRTVLFAQFSPDGTKIVTAGDRVACIWSSRSGKMIGQPMVHQGDVTHAEFSPDGKHIVTASWLDHAAFVWDAETGSQIGGPLAHQDWVTHATFSPDGQWVLTTSADRNACLWEVHTVVSPAPPWLAELAEAIAGDRIDQAGAHHSVALDRLLELKLRLTASAATDTYTQWAKWFFADRSTRPLTTRNHFTPSL